MLEEKFEIREHVVKESILVSQKRFCDVCGKEIENMQYYWTGDISKYTCDGYVNEDFDACSAKCLKEKFDQYCNLSSDNSRYEIGVESRLFKRKT